jgi:hypothetical protein
LLRQPATIKPEFHAAIYPLKCFLQAFKGVCL